MARRGAARQLAPIVAKRAKVDREEPRRAHGRDAVRQPKRSGVSNLHARMYKTVARPEGKGAEFPKRPMSFMDEV